MKTEPQHAWIEPQIMVRSAWRKHRVRPWVPAICAVFVLALSLYAGASIFSLTTISTVALAYVLGLLWCWTWPFLAARSVILYPSKIWIYQGRTRDEIAFSQLARVEAEESEEGQAIRLVNESGRSVRIFLGSDVTLASLETEFRQASVPWKNANQPLEPTAPSGRGSS